MKSKPLFPNQAVSKTGLSPSEDLIEVIQRIVADLKEQDAAIAANSAAADANSDAIALLGSAARLASDVTNSTTVLADTGLSFPVSASVRYRFSFMVDFFTAATTTGIRLVIDGAAATYMNYNHVVQTGATTQDAVYGLSAYSLPAAATATSQANFNLATISGIIQPSTNGTVKLRFASEVAASTATVRAATNVTWAAMP